jgi:hypothetical protein
MAGLRFLFETRSAINGASLALLFFPSPLVGEGGFERSEKPGEGAFQ